MNRRRFLAALAAIPFLRRLAPKSVTADGGGPSEVRIRVRNYSPFPFAGDPHFYGGMQLRAIGLSGSGPTTWEVSDDGEPWRPA